jgi:hypothetical protein
MSSLLVTFLWIILALNPLLSLDPHLLFPDGNDLFQAVNTISGGLKNTTIPVSAGTNDLDGWCPWI